MKTESWLYLSRVFLFMCITHLIRKLGGPSALKILTPRTSCQSPGPGIRKWRSLSSPLPLLRACLVEKPLLFLDKFSPAFSLGPFFNWGSVDRRMQLVKQNCWLSLASSCQGNGDEDRGFGREASEFFWQVSQISIRPDSHYRVRLASWLASSSHSWPWAGEGHTRLGAALPWGKESGVWVLSCEE